jgi:tRNA(Arg) A34 adenosine deaminase TadA
MTTRWGAIHLDLPDWLEQSVAPGFSASTTADRMEFVIDLARRNVRAETGGPFAAAVFEEETGRLVAPGVNRVVPTTVSFAHAEIMAIGGANALTGAFDLGGPDQPAMQLVASTEPCALCLGATVWSGVRSILTGARDADARRIGFDEGPKVEDWVGALEKRGIAVTTDVLREAAVAVLDEYAASGQVIYNGRRDA